MKGLNTVCQWHSFFWTGFGLVLVGCLCGWSDRVDRGNPIVYFKGSQKRNGKLYRERNIVRIKGQLINNLWHVVGFILTSDPQTHINLVKSIVTSDQEHSELWSVAHWPLINSITEYSKYWTCKYSIDQRSLFCWSEVSILSTRVIYVCTRVIYVWSTEYWPLLVNRLLTSGQYAFSSGQ